MASISMTAQPSKTPTSAGAAAAVIDTVQDTLRELHAGDSDLPPVLLSSVLDRDLGFDSLGRMELLLRTERAFGVALPADTLQRAETVGDLLGAVQRAHSLMDAAHARSDGAAAAALPGPLITPEGPEASTGPPGTPAHATTLLDVLAWHVQTHPEQTQVVVLPDDALEGGEQRISYRQLADASAAVAAGLQRAGVVSRESVAIMLPTSADYFSIYVGILMAGAIPVPIYPPARASQLEDHVLRHGGILDNARAVMLVTVAEAKVVARLLHARVPGLRHVVTPQQLASAGGTPTPMTVRGDDIALIQYTSGSTGQPKGVALTHANLLANIRAMAQSIDATPRDVFVSWLPLYHDMGLIGAWLAPLYVGFPLVVVSPLAFLAKPLRWLQAIHRWRGTLSAGPNFAYELCLKRIDDTALAGLDLGTWRLAFNGAEAVSPDTVRHFAERFAACGLRPEVVAPVYGLAEASVGLLFPPLGRVAPIDAIARELFTRERRAVSAAPDDASALRFVACVRPLPGHAVRILDGHELRGRYALALGPHHIGQTEPERQHAAEVAEAPAPARHAAQAVAARLFGQECGDQRFTVAVEQVGQHHRRDGPSHVAGTDPRQCERRDHATRGGEQQQAFLGCAQIGVGAERGHGQHDEQTRQRQCAGPGHRCPRCVAGDTAHEVGAEDCRQHHRGVARVGEVVHRPTEHLALAHAVVQRVLGKEGHGAFSLLGAAMAGFVRSARVAVAGCLLPAVLTACATPPNALPIAAVTFDAASPAMHSIHVVNHGWHTGLVLRAGDVPAAAWPVKADFPGATYFEVGWGDRAYYLAVDPGAWLGLKAVAWPTPSVLHVVAVDTTLEGFTAATGISESIEIGVSPAGMQRLLEHLRNSHELDDAGRSITLGPGLYGQSRFYASRERFHLFKTCNVWVAKALQTAGVPVTPVAAITASRLMAQLRPLAKVVP